MHELVTAIGIVNSVVYVALAAVSVVHWRSRRDRAAGWLALAFLALGLLTSVGRLVPAHPHGFGPVAAQRLDIELLVLFPYLLYRFATQFSPPSRRLQRIVAGLTLALTIWTFALPSLPGAGQPRPAWFVAYLIAFLVHWATLSTVVAVRLWRAGRGQPSVAAKRMRMLSYASAALTVAIIGVAFETHQASAGAVAIQAIGFLAGIAFLLGIVPPTIVRELWRRPEQEKMQEAIRSLLRLATTRAEVAQRVLTPVAGMVGASAAAIVAEGRVLASEGLRDETVERLAAGQDPVAPRSVQVVRVEAPGATLLAWTSPYAPFFGGEELRLLETVAALCGIALDRVRLFEQEHDARLALERANEVMANFVALAAHELRTPVTTIHGFVQTLHHLDDRLSAEQQAELRLALEQQTVRMASLVEQLLDLSRLDADAVVVRRQPVDVGRRLEEVATVAAGRHAEDVVVEVPEHLRADVDPYILDRIVTNLITNAFRYGRPPVRVTAAGRNGAVSVAVEDEGPGVAAELEDTLFDRFTRAGVSRDRVAGTGLGLAIARAYARAHDGDLRYERGRVGARFVVDLPTG